VFTRRLKNQLVHSHVWPGGTPGLFPGKNFSPGITTGVSSAIAGFNDRNSMKTNLNPILTIPTDRDLAADAVQEAVSHGLTIAIFATGTNEAEPAQPSETRVVATKEADQRPKSAVRLYTCKNCGGQMKLSDLGNYCGVLSCPVCGRVISRFDVIEE
jgi:hypothetical protein